MKRKKTIADIAKKRIAATSGNGDSTSGTGGTMPYRYATKAYYDRDPLPEEEKQKARRTQYNRARGQAGWGANPVAEYQREKRRQNDPKSGKMAP